MSWWKIEPVQEFCNLGRFALAPVAGSNDKEIQRRIGKENSAFNRLNHIHIWRDKQLGLHIRIKIYNATVVAILDYRQQTIRRRLSWVAENNNSLLRVSCKKTNEEVRRRCQIANKEQYSNRLVNRPTYQCTYVLPWTLTLLSGDWKSLSSAIIIIIIIFYTHGSIDPGG